MPTGYTSDLYNGKDVSFSEFVLGCSRAFGALILMRDDPRDTPIPDEIKADTSYHSERVAAAYDLQDELAKWTPEDAEKAAQSAYDAEVKRWKEYEKERIALWQRYQDMLVQVIAWEPPTPDHVGLKDFMVEQIETSIKFDASPSSPPVKLSGPEYASKEVQRAMRDISYHTEEIEKELDRAENRTAWVKALKDSLSEYANL